MLELLWKPFCLSLSFILFWLIYIADTPTVRQENAIIKTLLISLVPLLLLTLIIISAFLIWRCCHENSSAVDLHQQHQPLLLPPSPLDPAKSHLAIQLLELRAQGRFGFVYRALLSSAAPGQSSVVAVKVVRSSERQSWINERAFYSNSALASHDNVLRFFGAEQHDADLWIITEYHERGSLYDHLKGSMVSWSELTSIATSLARGLAFLHSDVNHPSIAHRDIKSRNVLLRNDMTACIADFGLAIVLDENVSDVHAQVSYNLNVVVVQCFT